MRLTTAQRERAAGVLVGQACGDALGVPYEFASPPGDGRPRMIGGGLGNYAPGEWSDDTQMALCIAEVAATGVDLRSPDALDAIATRFEQWYAGRPADVGAQTSRVLSLARTLPGRPAERLRQASRRVHEQTGRSAGNGALMRTAPVSLAYLDDPAGAAEAARAIAELTHHDPLAGDSCVLWTDMIRQVVLTGERWVIDLELIPLERRDFWTDLVAATLEGEPSDFNPNGDSMRAFQAALAAAMVGLQSDSGAMVRDGLTAAVLAGHDTDTVAAIAGGLLGGICGLGAIPPDWVVDLNGWPGYRSHDLVRLALATAHGGGIEGVWPQRARMEHPAARPLARPHPFDADVLIGTLADLDRVDELRGRGHLALPGRPRPDRPRAGASGPARPAVADRLRRPCGQPQPVCRAHRRGPPHPVLALAGAPGAGARRRCGTSRAECGAGLCGHARCRCR